MFAALDLLREGVVAGEDSAIEFSSVHVIHGGGGVFALEESDEAEGAMLLSGLIKRSLDVLDLAEGDEGGVEDRFVHLLR